MKHTKNKQQKNIKLHKINIFWNRAEYFIESETHHPVDED